MNGSYRPLVVAISAVVLAHSACSSSSPPACTDACFLILASGQSHPVGLAVDSSSVFWTNQTPPSLRKVSLCGGDSTEIAGPSTGPNNGNASAFGALAVRDPYVFWWAVSTTQEPTPEGLIVDGSISAMSANVNGGAAMYSVGAGGGSGPITVGGIATNADGAYYDSESALIAAPIPPIASGGGAVVPTRGRAGGLATDDAYVYGTNLTKPGSVDKAKTGGVALDGAFVTLATGQDGASGIAVDAESVYWTATGTGNVMSVPKGGGTPVTLASHQDAPASIAVNASGLYWTTGSGTVMRLASDGGAPTTIASQQGELSAIVADASHVYWANGAVNGSVTKFTPGIGCP